VLADDPSKAQLSAAFSADAEAIAVIKVRILNITDTSFLARG
jgi:hypothetical protein